MARTGRSRKGVGGPKTPEGRAKALMNLRPFQEARQTAEKESSARERFSLRGRDYSGVNTIDIWQPQTQALAEELTGIIEGDPAAYLKPADRVTVGLFAVTLRRIRQVEAYLDKVGGLTNAKGRVRPVVEVLIRLLKEAREFANVLGLTPMARARLGLDVARASTDLAALLAEAANPEPEEVTTDGESAGSKDESLADGPDPVR